MHEGAVASRLGLEGIPSISESVAVARDAALAEYEGGRIHICHVSAVETVEEIRRAKARGIRITGEVTPHHLVLTDDAVNSLDPGRHKMNPPLREESDRQALIAALADGTLDCVATDHAPHAADEKEVPFEEAPFGVTGLETAFAACHTHLVRTGLLPLETAGAPHGRRRGRGARPAGADARRRRGGRPGADRPRGGGDGGRRAASGASRATRRSSARSSGAGCALTIAGGQDRMADRRDRAPPGAAAPRATPA